MSSASDIVISMLATGGRSSPLRPVGWGARELGLYPATKPAELAAVWMERCSEPQGVCLAFVGGLKSAEMLENGRFRIGSSLTWFCRGLSGAKSLSRSS